jgi:excisionase family DNA binding protein
MHDANFDDEHDGDMTDHDFESLEDSFDTEDLSGDCEWELPEPLLMTTEAAADLLCISTTTLRQLVRRDRLHCVEFVATGFKRPIRRFRRSDLEAFINASSR